MKIFYFRGASVAVFHYAMLFLLFPFIFRFSSLIIYRPNSCLTLKRCMSSYPRKAHGIFLLRARCPHSTLWDEFVCDIFIPMTNSCALAQLPVALVLEAIFYLRATPPLRKLYSKFAVSVFPIRLQCARHYSSHIWQPNFISLLSFPINWFSLHCRLNERSIDRNSDRVVLSCATAHDSK
jgi:hypothetical protein